MTQVFLTKSSTSPWSVPSDFSVGWSLDTSGLDTYINVVQFGTATHIIKAVQSFTATGSAPLTSVTAKVSVPFGGGSDQVQVQVYSGDPAGGTLGSLLATSKAITLLSTTFVSVTFTFNSPPSLTNGSVYSIAFSRTGSLSDSNPYAVGVSSSSVYSGGTLSYTLDGTNYVDNGNDTSLILNGSVHTTEMVGAGGSGAAGTTGSSGNGGGGGGGGAYTKLTYSSGTITPGTTTIPFLVIAGGDGTGGNAWEGTTGNFGNCYQDAAAKNASGTTFGAQGTPVSAATGTPSITYTIAGSNGGQGASSGKNLGGSGGGGAAGPNGAGGNGGAATTTAGGNGGYADNDTTNNITASGGSAGKSSVGNKGNNDGSLSAFPVSMKYSSIGAQGFGNASTNLKLMQSFIPYVSDTIKAVQVPIQKTGSPTDNLVVDIFAVDGSGAPTGSSLGTSTTVAGSTLSIASYNPAVFTFSSPPSLVSNTSYAFVISRSGAADSSNFYNTKIGSTTYFDGTYGTFNSSTSTWSLSGSSDIYFATFNDSAMGGSGFGGGGAGADATNEVTSPVAGAGGSYGGGGGGYGYARGSFSGAVVGVGADGLIVVSYPPAVIIPSIPNDIVAVKFAIYRASYW